MQEKGKLIGMLESVTRQILNRMPKIIHQDEAEQLENVDLDDTGALSEFVETYYLMEDPSTEGVLRMALMEAVTARTKSARQGPQ